MRTTWGVLALGASLSFISPVQAQEPGCGGCKGEKKKAETSIPVDQDDEIKKLEKQLNKILLVDESGKIVLREEFKGSLPFPPERLQRMLASFVELGPDGRIRIKNPERIRPYLPLIKRFLNQGGLKKLQELSKLPPEERRKAMRRLLGGATPVPPRTRKPDREGKPDDRDRRRRRARRPRPEPRDEDPHADPHAFGKRIERIERSVQRIERMLGELMRRSQRFGEERRRRGTDRDRGRRDWRERFDPREQFERWRERFDPREQFERWRERFDPREQFERWRERGRQFQRRWGEERPLRRLFERWRDRRGRDGDRNRDRDRRGWQQWRQGFGEMMERGQVWRRGLRKLMDLMEPEDYQALERAIRSLGKFDMRDMRDPSKLFRELSRNLDPQDMARLMEVFSEFVATEEGRAMQKEIERLVERMERFADSPEGERMTEFLKRLQKRLGEGEGSLRERLERLLRGRQGERPRARQPRRERPRARQPRRERPRAREPRPERRSSRRRHERRIEKVKPQPRNPKAKLY